MYRKAKTITVYVRKTIYDGDYKMHNINVIDYSFFFYYQMHKE